MCIGSYAQYMLVPIDGDERIKAMWLLWHQESPGWQL